MRMFFIRLWKWLVAFTIQSTKDMGSVLMTINIQENGVSVSQFKPTNPNARLLAAALSQEFLERWQMVSTFNQIETATWNQRSFEMEKQGVQLPCLMALREIETNRGIRDNRDVT